MLCIKETKGFKIINKNRKINIEIQEPWTIYDDRERNPVLLLKTLHRLGNLAAVIFNKFFKLFKEVYYLMLYKLGVF